MIGKHQTLNSLLCVRILLVLLTNKNFHEIRKRNLSFALNSVLTIILFIAQLTPAP